MRRFFAKADYKFIELRRKAYMVSGSVLVIGLIAALFWQFQGGSWLNYGVDFAGGTLVQVRFEGAASVGELRDLLGPSFPGSEITRLKCPPSSFPNSPLWWTRRA